MIARVALPRVMTALSLHNLSFFANKSDASQTVSAYEYRLK